MASARRLHGSPAAPTANRLHHAHHFIQMKAEELVCRGVNNPNNRCSNLRPVPFVISPHRGPAMNHTLSARGNYGSCLQGDAARSARVNRCNK